MVTCSAQTLLALATGEQTSRFLSDLPIDAIWSGTPATPVSFQYHDVSFKYHYVSFKYYFVFFKYHVSFKYTFSAVNWGQSFHKEYQAEDLGRQTAGSKVQSQTGQPVVIYLQGLVAHLAGSSCSKSWWPASLLLSGRFGGEIMSYIASEVVHAAQTVRVWKPVTLSKAGSASTEDSVTCSLGSKCHDV